MIADILITVFLVVGGAFAAVGAFGLIKLDDPMSRLHAPTKISTLGIGGLLMASMINAFAHEDGSLHEVLIMGFLFVTAPLAAHFIAKAHIHRLVRSEDLPSPGGDEVWATLGGADPKPAPPEGVQPRE